MKRSSSLLLAGFCAIGLLSGFAVRRIVSGNPGSTATREVGAAWKDAGEKSSAPPVTIALPEIPIARSTDTVDAVLAADPVTGYARIASWLATASEQEIAAYWAAYKEGERDSDITELIFINWTRLNPRAAIAGAAAGGNGFSAWEAWAATDPKAALAAALAVGEEQAGYVASGIGKFAPEWLREHFEELPESARHNALSALDRWKDAANPLESLEFTRKTGGTGDEETFRNLARQDPWKALDWLNENPAYADDRTSPSSNFADVLFSTMAEERPEELAALADRTPAGAMRRQMEQALFDRLLETDPAAAIEQARATGKTSPLVAAQQLGEIGLRLVGTEPEKAFQLAGKILKANTGSLDIAQIIDYPDGGRGFSPTGKATEFMNALFDKDRLKTMEMLASQPAGETGNSEILFQYAGKWAQKDLPGFTDWTKQQTGIAYETAARQVGFTLAAKGDFLGSIEWAKSGGLAPDKAYNAVLFYWNRADPVAADAWIENSDLTGEQKTKYRETLKKYHR